MKLEPRSSSDANSVTDTCWIWGQAKEVAIAKCNKETYVTFAFSLARKKIKKSHKPQAASSKLDSESRIM